MPRYVHVSEGPTATEANDLLVVADPELVRDVGRLIARRLGVALPALRERQGPTLVSLKPEGEAKP